MELKLLGGTACAIENFIIFVFQSNTLINDQGLVREKQYD